MIAAAQRLKEEVRTAAWIQLGLRRGLGALRYLRPIREAEPDSDSRRSLVRAVIHGGRQNVDALAEAAVRENDDEAWYVVWNAVHFGRTIGGPWVGQSLASPVPRLRAITYWNWAMLVSAGATLQPATVKALDTTPEAEADPKETPKDWRTHEALFSFELLRRARGGKPREDLDWARNVPKGRSPWPFPGLHTPIARLLTKGERAALIESGHFDRDIEKRLEMRRPPRSFASLPEGATRAFAFDSLPKGYATGLVALTGCHESVLNVDMTYDGAGRPTSTKLRKADALSAVCRDTAQILAASHPVDQWLDWTSVEGGTPEPGPERLIIEGLDEKTLAALEAAETENRNYAEADGVRFLSRDIEPPKPLHMELAHLPAGSQRRVAYVTVEIVIDEKGDVAKARVLRGTEDLDALGVAAAQKWSFKPAKQAGKAVAVRMAISVPVVPYGTSFEMR